MPVYAITVVKSALAYGRREEFSNTYHYDIAPGTPNIPETLAVVVSEAERAIFGVSVNFERAVVYGPTDGPAFENVILDTIDLDGTGAVNGTPIHRVACVMVRWDAPRSPTTNRRRWLRKYLHVGQMPPQASNEVSQGQAVLDATSMNLYEGFAEELLGVGGGGVPGEGRLTNERGDADAVGTWKVHPYVITRDLKI